MLKILKKGMLIAFLGSMALTSCKQEEVEVQKVDVKQKVDIATLTKYFANRINVGVDEIKYNEKTQQFSFRGVDQVSLEQLTQFYLNSQMK